MAPHDKVCTAVVVMGNGDQFELDASITPEISLCSLPSVFIRKTWERPPLRLEDLVAVGRPGGATIGRTRILCQVGRSGAVGVHHEDIE